MKFYEFGNRDNPTLLLLPGTCSHWKNNFGYVIKLLQDTFLVICVSYDGFDETEHTVFPDMITETEKIESFLNERFAGKIHAAYGCSMGGSFVGLLMQRNRIHMEHGILGSSDLDQEDGYTAKLQAKLVSAILYRVLQKGKLNPFVRKWLKKKAGPKYFDLLKRMILGSGGQNMSFVEKKSIENQFYSDLVTKLNDGIEVANTTVHCLYAAKMGSQYLERYRQHFINPDIIEHDLQHEELLACRPQEWADVIKRSVL
jgi:hypothetical protein